MVIRHYRRDPRTEDQRRADEEVLLRFEGGEFLAVDPAVEREAVDQAQCRQQARRPSSTGPR